MPPGNETLDTRLALVERSMEQTTEALKEMAQALRDLMKMEAHYAEMREALGRAFAGIEKMSEAAQKQHDILEERVRMVENVLPELKTTSRWVKYGVIAVVAAAMASVGDMIFTHVSHGQQVVYVQAPSQIPQLPQLPQLKQQVQP